ncbi:hypothetical protein [Pseudomonas sp. M5]|uniref:hypothetical protein n=1 Tax=Pseudomonas sp. M5 TaxID=1620788 RepID=UPI0019569D09|nr:hypothetical protein [Pseudomonas sp. M5]MBM7397404.1 hypothetical protein [Pseudomonas sp. M5]HDS1756188.1 hypothetical protein [Pseudomonas putida]
MDGKEELHFERAIPTPSKNKLLKSTLKTSSKSQPKATRQAPKKNPKVVVPNFYGTNGQPVTCTYVNHPAWDDKTNICMTLHFIMLKIGPTRTNAWGYSLRLAICYFLDFLAEHNRNNPRALHLKHIRDITPSIFRAFALFLDKSGKSRKHTASLKSALKNAANESIAVPMLDLPAISSVTYAATEPLSEEGVTTLTIAARRIVDAARETIERRKIIDCSAPYTLEELKRVFSPELTKEDILIWVKYNIENEIPFDKSTALTRINKCNDPEIAPLSKERFLIKALKKILAAHPKIQIPQNYDPNIRRLDSWRNTELDPYRVVRTLNDHEFPLRFSTKELRESYLASENSSIHDCDNVVKLILHKLYCVRPRFNTYYGKEGRYMLSLNEHLALYYPTATDMAGIASLMMLQAGWNKETLMQLDRDNFEHSLTSTVEQSIKIIYSEKNRAQGSMVPYAKPKQILASSDSENPYSFYNLIILAKEFSAPLAQYLTGVIDPLRNRQINTLFAFIRPWAGWAKSSDSGSLATLDHSTQFAFAIANLLERYEVTDNGKRLTSASEITRRLRVTWLYYNAESIPFAFLSQLMGHQSRDTSDSSYDNSPQARMRRFKRLRSALEHVVKLLRSRKFKGLLGKRASTLANTHLSIFFLPHLDRPLWACSDRYKPDWAGAPKLPNGVKCCALEQCFFCSRVWILEDSLPYLIERLAHIDELLHDGNSSDFGNQLEAEHEALSAILNDWPDEYSINDALEYRTLNSPLLPRNLRELRLIFKTGDLDE